MKTVLDEPNVDSGHEVRACSSACSCETCGHELADRLEKRVHDAKAALSAKLEKGKITAERLVERGRDAVDHRITETAHTVGRNPFSALGIAFAIGAAFGFLVPRLKSK